MKTQTYKLTLPGGKTKVINQKQIKWLKTILKDEITPEDHIFRDDKIIYINEYSDNEIKAQGYSSADLYGNKNLMQFARLKGLISTTEQTAMFLPSVQENDTFIMYMAGIKAVSRNEAEREWFKRIIDDLLYIESVN